MTSLGSAIIDRCVVRSLHIISSLFLKGLSFCLKICVSNTIMAAVSLLSPRQWTFSMSEDIFDCHSWGGCWVLLASGGWRPGSLLNTLQGTGPLPPAPLQQSVLTKCQYCWGRELWIRQIVETHIIQLWATGMMEIHVQEEIGFESCVT